MPRQAPTTGPGRTPARPTRAPRREAAGIITAPATGRRPLPIVPQTMEEAMTLARAIVASRMAPRGLDTPEACMIAILHGLEVGLTPLMALQRLAVIDGRPTIWGDGALALVRASGLCRCVREWVEGSRPEAWIAHCEVLRAGEDRPVRRSFGVEDAKRAALWGQAGPWTAYPKRMLQMRARAFALRDVFADVLGGLYLREEMEEPIPSGYATESSREEDRDGSADAHHRTDRPKARGGEASGEGLASASVTSLATARRPLAPSGRAYGAAARMAGFMRRPASGTIKAPPPPDLDDQAGGRPAEPGAAAGPSGDPQDTLDLLDSALACAQDRATLDEITAEFEGRLAALPQDGQRRAQRIRERHEDRVTASEAPGGAP